jgi:isopenicillin-N N-acyltransferase-like protein
MVVMSGLPIIDLAGSPFDLGRGHGTALAGRIGTNYALYSRIIHETTGLNQPALFGAARRFLESLEEHAPELAEELAGLAAGSGLPQEAIMVLNARSELAYSAGLAGGGECTAVGLEGSRSLGGMSLLAQNWDWLPALKDGLAVLRLAPRRGPRLLAFVEAGQVAKIGLNEAGLGVLLNMVHGPAAATGLPVHVLLRLILECGDVAAAAALLQGLPRAGSAHFLVGQAQGPVRGLETSPAGVAELAAAEGVLAHTNHFLDPVLAQVDKGLSLILDSPSRLRRALRLLAAQATWDPAGLEEIFRDHQGLPGAICRHQDPAAPVHFRMETVASLILDLGTRRARVSLGQPCVVSSQEIRL